MVDGFSKPEWDAVRLEFERNFTERGEIGASVCVTVGGDTVVDLWGGVADPETGRPWERDTIGVVWSCTKGAVALCAHLLVAQGKLDLDAPVADYWPEFAKNGKEAIRVRALLSHQAGLPALRDPLPEGGLNDWELVTDALAKEEPFWEPGTRHGYHALTFGHLVGEVIRRATGRTIGVFFREEVAGPLGLDFWIGLPEEHEARVAPNISADPPSPDAPVPTFYRSALFDPGSIAAMCANNSGGVLLPGAVNNRATHAAESPSFSSITNGRGLAGLYRPLALGGAADGVRLVPESTVLVDMSAVASAAVDATMGVPTRFSLGFVKAIDNHVLPPGDRDSVVLSDSAFGHVGSGGSIGFADPAAGLSFGYTMNKQGLTVGLDARAQSLIDAAYRTLGYRQPPAGGLWYR